jgi:hypothetical protein
LFFVQSAGILLSANVVGKDKSPLGVERLVRLRLGIIGGVAGPAAGAAVAGGFDATAKKEARIYIRQKNPQLPQVLGSPERSPLTKRARLFYSREHFTQRRF